MNRKLQESIESVTQLKLETSLEQRQILYSRLKASREQASFAIMMRMDPSTLTCIRREFYMKEDSVDLDHFVFILHKHLSAHVAINEAEKKEFAANMVDLFKDIDVNGDKKVSWIELTSYIVEKAGAIKNDFKVISFSHYQNSTHTLHQSSQQWRRFDYSQILPLPNGQFAAIEDLRKVLYVLNSKSGELVRTFKTNAVPMALAYAKDGSSDLLLASCSDMSIVVHSLDDPSKKRGIPNTVHAWSTQDIQMSLAYMQSSSTLYSGAYKSISAWSMKDREEICRIPNAHGDIVMDMILLKNLDTLVSCSLDKSIINWDTTTNKPIVTYEGHRTGVFNLSYTSTYRLLVSVGFDHGMLPIYSS